MIKIIDEIMNVFAAFSAYFSIFILRISSILILLSSSGMIFDRLESIAFVIKFIWIGLNMKLAQNKGKIKFNIIKKMTNKF